MNYRNALNYEGKVVLITGAGGGIGAGFVKGFAECGATVVAIGRDYTKIDKVISDLGDLKRDSMAISIDVTDAEAVKKQVDVIYEKYGKIDVLMNHAGMNIRKPAVEFSEEEWNKISDTNLKGIFLMAQAVGKKMIQQGFGSIVNTASVSAARGHCNLAPYAATKGGIVQLTKVLAHEWAPYGIRVNSIGPGYVMTNQTQNLLNDPVKYNELISKIPMARFGKVEEMVGPALFLCSELAGYITGHTLYIEGGRLID